MNRIQTSLLAVMVLAGLALAPVAGASPVGLGTVEVNAGYAKSSNEMLSDGSSLSGGLSFGAGYYRSIVPTISWGIEGSFDNLGSVDYIDTFDASTGTVSSSLFRVTPELRFNAGVGVGPSFFGQVGGGLYNVSVEDKNDTYGTVEGSDSKFGFNVGAGVNFPVAPKSKMSLSGHYHSVATEGESLNYLQIRAGIGFSL